MLVCEQAPIIGPAIQRRSGQIGSPRQEKIGLMEPMRAEREPRPRQAPRPALPDNGRVR